MKNKEKLFDEFLEAVSDEAFCRNNAILNFFGKHLHIDGMVSKAEFDEKLKEWLEQEYVEKPKTVWELKKRDIYWRLDDVGRAVKEVWGDTEFDKKVRSHNRVFLTKEEAEYYSKREEVEAIVKKHAHEFTAEEWKDGYIKKYHPYFDYEDMVVNSSYVVTFRSNELYFKSREYIRAAIAEVGEADFIKYYLGVKDDE